MLVTWLKGALFRNFATLAVMRYLLTLGFVILLFLKGEGQYVLVENNPASDYNYSHSYLLNPDNTFEYFYLGCTGGGFGKGTYTKHGGRLVMNFDSVIPPSSVILPDVKKDVTGIKISLKKILGKDTIPLSGFDVELIDSLNKIIGEYRTDKEGALQLPFIKSAIIKSPQSYISRFILKPSPNHNSYVIYPVFDRGIYYIKAGTVHVLRKKSKRYERIQPPTAKGYTVRFYRLKRPQ